MDAEQVGQTPILGREELLRLVEVVERLLARARGEKGGSSWTTGRMLPQTLAQQWAAVKECWAGLPEANRRSAVWWLAVLAIRVVAARVPGAGPAEPTSRTWPVKGDGHDRGDGVGAAGRQGDPPGIWICCRLSMSASRPGSRSLTMGVDPAAVRAGGAGGRAGLGGVAGDGDR